MAVAIGGGTRARFSAFGAVIVRGGDGSTYLLSTAKTLKGHSARAGIIPDPESPMFVSGAIAARSTHIRTTVRQFIAHVRADFGAARKTG